MAKQQDEERRPVRFDLVPEFFELADAICDARQKKSGERPSRAAVMREAMRRGLQAMSAEEVKPKR